MATRGYASDLTDAQWATLAPLLAPSGLGRPLQHDLRVLTNAILYVLRTGCQWRMLPQDFPPWSTVYHHFRKWRDSGTWEAVTQTLRQQVRSARSGRPTPARRSSIFRSVQNHGKRGPRGYDGGKRVNRPEAPYLGGYCGLATGSGGASADIQDRDGAFAVLEQAAHRRGRWHSLGRRGLSRAVCALGSRSVGLDHRDWATRGRTQSASPCSRAAGWWSGLSPGWVVAGA